MATLDPCSSMHRQWNWFKLWWNTFVFKKPSIPIFPEIFFFLVHFVFVLRLCQVHSQAMRQPADLQKRLLVCGLKRRRKHHKLLQHSQSVQLQRSQVRSHAHTPAAGDCRGVIDAVALKVAPLTLCWDFGLWTCVSLDVNLSLPGRRFFKNLHNYPCIISIAPNNRLAN